MWAIVEIGKKQYKVTKGETIAVQRLAKAKGKITFDKVLVVSKNKTIEFGTPYLKNAKISADIVEEKKEKKVLIYKYNRRKKYRRTQGHRQILTHLKISDIATAKQ